MAMQAECQKVKTCIGEHQWRVTSSPVKGDRRFRYCKCKNCGATQVYDLPLKYAPKLSTGAL